MKSYQILLAAVVSVSLLPFVMADGSDPWCDIADCDDNWEYRKEIEIQSGFVDGGPHSNFPILVLLTSDSDLSSNAQDDADDLRFTNTDGTELYDHELERYVNGTGELISWVRIPSLVGSSDTRIYMYYGNNATSTVENATGVWDSNYVSVWHLEETPGGSDSILESTSEANHFTPNNTSTVTAKIGNGTDVQTSNDRLLATHLLSFGDGSATLSFWANSDDVGSDVDYWLSIAEDFASSETSIELGSTHAAFIGNGMSSCDECPGAPVWIDTVANTWTTSDEDVWNYVALVIDNSTSPVFYKNGIAQTMDTTDYNQIDGSIDVVVFGERANGIGNIEGQGDEVRISNTTRSANWISTEYNNQDSPNTFYILGPQENNNSTSVVPSSGVILGNLDTGLFLFMVIAAFAFTLVSFRAVSMFSGFLQVIAFALFIGLYLILAAGVEVSTITTDLEYNNAGSLVSNSTITEVLITGGTDTNWISWVFLGFAVLSFMLMVRTFSGVTK